MEYVLETNGLSKRYRDFTALNGLNIHIPKGSIYGFIGRNGAGKTTFMKIISGLSAPSEGEFSLFGYPYSEISKVRNRVGCLIEAPGLYPDMSAFQNLKAKFNREVVEDIIYAVIVILRQGNGMCQNTVSLYIFYILHYKKQKKKNLVH